MDIKTPKYNYKAQVSFEKRRLFSRSLVKGTIISYRYVNYTWLYLIECCDDKQLVVVPEDNLWLLTSDEI